jgi:hypothetical protein
VFEIIFSILAFIDLGMFASQTMLKKNCQRNTEEAQKGSGYAIKIGQIMPGRLRIFLFG